MVDIRNSVSVVQPLHPEADWDEWERYLESRELWNFHYRQHMARVEIEMFDFEAKEREADQVYEHIVAVHYEKQQRLDRLKQLALEVASQRVCRPKFVQVRDDRLPPMPVKVVILRGPSASKGARPRKFRFQRLAVG